MRALSVRQPYAEAILRGVKTIEYRSRPTRVVGEAFYLYASKTLVAGAGFGAALPRGVWSTDLAVPGEPPAPWVAELAEMLRQQRPGVAWPTGVIVGTAVIDRVTRRAAAAAGAGMYEWHLTDVRRLPQPIKPDRHPQPAWFRPF
jgi:hypothetical protein